MKLRKEKVSDKKSKNLFFGFFKKHKAISISLITVVMILGSFLVINYSRYVKDIVQLYYLRTKNFYFNSDKLTIHGKNYTIYPWEGTLDYDITINMNSMLNSLKTTDSTILYDVTFNCDSRVTCYIGSPGTTLSHRSLSETSDYMDTFKITVSPNTTLHDDDEIEVEIIATSTSPYVEELKATFTLKVGNYGLNYKIEDQVGRIYFDSIVTNTLDNETALVELSITNLADVSIDMSNDILTIIESDGNNNTNATTATYDGHSYIKTITFTMVPKSSMLVRYYKANPANNYESDGTGSPIVSFRRIS